MLEHRGQVCSLVFEWELIFSLQLFAFILETSIFFLCCSLPSRREGHLLSYPLFICEKQFDLIIFSAAGGQPGSLPLERIMGGNAVNMF
jgi:hypothetical protein